MARPRSIVLFGRFWLGSVALAILAILLDYAALRERAVSNGSSPAGNILGIVVNLAGGWVFWHLIVRRASNWARWLLIALMLLGLVSLPFGFSEVLAVGPLYAVLSGLAFLANMIACGLLLKADAAVWFKSKGQTIDPEVFS